MNPLKPFTDDQLIEELIRRRNQTAVDEPEHWCHDCEHFVAWNDKKRKGEMPDTYNPCTKRHAMSFKVPEEMGDDWGFYRTICADRAMKT